MLITTCNLIRNIFLWVSNINFDCFSQFIYLVLIKIYFIHKKFHYIYLGMGPTNTLKYNTHENVDNKKTVIKHNKKKLIRKER